MMHCCYYGDLPALNQQPGSAAGAETVFAGIAPRMARSRNAACNSNIKTHCPANRKGIFLIPSDSIKKPFTGTAFF